MDKALNKINELISESDKLRDEAEKLGNQYTKENAKYKSGDKLIIKDRYLSTPVYVRVSMVRFNAESLLKGKASYNFEVWKKDFKGKAERRYNLWMKDNSQYTIIKKVNL